MKTPLIHKRENSDIKGILTGSEEIKLSAYADDADFLTPDVKSLELIFQTCEKSKSFSSLKLDLEKSEAAGLGQKERIETRYQQSNPRKLAGQWCLIYLDKDKL